MRDEESHLADEGEVEQFRAWGACEHRADEIVTELRQDPADGVLHVDREALEELNERCTRARGHERVRWTVYRGETHPREHTFSPGMDMHMGMALNLLSAVMPMSMPKHPRETWTWTWKLNSSSPSRLKKNFASQSEKVAALLVLVP